MEICALPVTHKVKIFKLDGVGPLITDPPQINFTTLSEKKKKKSNM